MQLAKRMVKYRTSRKMRVLRGERSPVIEANAVYVMGGRAGKRKKQTAKKTQQDIISAVARNRSKANGAGLLGRAKTAFTRKAS